MADHAPREANYPSSSSLSPPPPAEEGPTSDRRFFFFQPLPAYHIFGLLNLLACFKMQITQAILKKFDPDAFGSAIERHQVFVRTFVKLLLPVERIER